MSWCRWARVQRRRSPADEQKLYDLLMDKREMVDEYFSLAISDDGAVETLPMLLRGYTPNLDRLPQFLLCLGARVGRRDLTAADNRSIGRRRSSVSRRSCASLPTFTPHAHCFRRAVTTTKMPAPTPPRRRRNPRITLGSLNTSCSPHSVAIPLGPKTCSDAR